MALESAAYISQLNSANPTGGDSVSRGDDHLRMVKQVLKNTFPGLSGPLTAAGVPSTPTGNLVATNVQAALAELDSTLSTDYFFNAAGVERYVATAGQTDFTILHTLYVPEAPVVVYINGLLQDPADAYTEMVAPAKGVILAEGAELGDEIVLEFAINGVVEGSAEYVTFIQAGTGAVATTVETKLREQYSVVGADRTGVVDCTAVVRQIFQNLTDNSELHFPPGIYLMSEAAAGDVTAFGKKIGYLVGKSNIKITGHNAEIRIVSHDIAANGGLIWLWLESCKHIEVSGFYFNMTFTGVKNSGSLYPFVGAIVAANTFTTGVQAQSALSENISVKNCRFKLYHPYGSYAQTTVGNDYGGDQNNGYKMFSFSFFGDYMATAYESQNRGYVAEDIIFLNGHNGYGLWPDAVSDVVCNRITGQSWVSKWSTNAGAYGGTGLPMIRYSQYYQNGLTVTNCNFRAKPCSERTTSGFEGYGAFAYIVQTVTGDYSNGKYIFQGNTIVLGNGDSAHSVIDDGITNVAYGDLIIDGNIFDGLTDTVNAGSGRHIVITGSGNGSATLVVSNNVFSRNNSYNDGIKIFNGSSVSAAQRKLKSLNVTNNTSLAQLQYFVDMMAGGTANTYDGVASAVITGNVINGTYCTVFGSGSANSIAARLACTETTDAVVFRDNRIVAKNTAYSVLGVNSAANILIEDNQLTGVTTNFIGGTLTLYQTKSGSFTPIMLGSTVAGSPATSYAIGRYMRKGNRCFVDIAIKITTAGGATGNWQVNLNDLPYTPANVNANMLWNLTTSSNILAGVGKIPTLVVNNATKLCSVLLSDQAGGAFSTLTVAADSDFALWASGSFEIALGT